jgi:hypothetical protein
VTFIISRRGPGKYWEMAPEYECFLYSELCLRNCQSVQQNFA